MRTMPSTFGRSSLSRRDDPDVFAFLREDDDKRFCSAEADCNISIFSFVDFMPRKDSVSKDLCGFFEADPVLALVAFGFFMVPFKSIEVEYECFPIMIHLPPPNAIDQSRIALSPVLLVAHAFVYIQTSLLFVKIERCIARDLSFPAD